MTAASTSSSTANTNLIIGVGLVASAVIVAALLVVGMTYNRKHSSDDHLETLPRSRGIESKASLERLIATINRKSPSPYEQEMRIHRMNSPFTAVTIRRDSESAVEPPQVQTSTLQLPLPQQSQQQPNNPTKHVGFYPDVKRGSAMYISSDEAGNADTIKEDLDVATLKDTLRHVPVVYTLN
ncbi:UNVERIFIED_CONTAM: hypothetical protein HDU68_008435 [Siphonaria sp. JEL0065]|nr:hypothetical protein HDU68_008435 [Siphonaria sp. JEL0065]